jgi:hypothetical protein
MKLKIYILALTALAVHNLSAQTTLPVIKASSTLVDIKADDVLRKNFWHIVPEAKPDVYSTSAQKVTFYTDMDSITFTIDPKVKKYDFIILLNEKDTAYTQIVYKRQSSDAKDFVVLDLFTSIPTNKPQNFNPRAINQGFRFAISYPVPLCKSNFSLGIGAGMSFHNFYTSALPKDIWSASMREKYGNDSYFIKIADITDPKIDCKKNKITFTYLDVPVELRYRSQKGFIVSAGAKVDFLVNSRLKYKGTDFIFGTDEEIKIKKHRLKHLSGVQAGPVMRIGWKRLNVFATYSFISVYNKNMDNTLNPVCVGISLMNGSVKK